MALFTLAFSNIIPWQDSFVHKATTDMVPRMYEILKVWPETGEPDPTPPPTTVSWVTLINKLIQWFKNLFK